jgi:phage-related protein
VAKAKAYYYLSPSGVNPVKNFLDSLSVKQQVKVLRIFQYLEEFGPTLAIPHLKKVSGTPLWEVRILGRDNIRLLYFVAKKDYILVLHGFIKKSGKTPKKELNVALNRLKDWKARSG